MPTMKFQGASRATLATLAVVLLLGGCASKNYQAPIEDRGRVGSGLSAYRMPPGYENAGKPGYYTVKPGDTVLRIALESGQNWRDVVAWNNLTNPNYIEIGQVLRIEPRAGDVVSPVGTATASAAPNSATTVAPTGNASTAPVGTAKIESRSLDGKPSASAVTKPITPAASVPATAPASLSTIPAASAPTVPVAADPAVPDINKDTQEPAWQWPVPGPLLGSFEEGRRKGLLLGGKAGDPVQAAADGRVVYAGSGLRGYGNLIIIKHNSQFLTAYAHNQTLLVKEDQVVRKGQKVAEMGSTDADRVQLHFEIRKQGKPIDPAKSLPAR
jgi:lipoprotein NlpD